MIIYWYPASPSKPRAPSETLFEARHSLPSCLSLLQLGDSVSNGSRDTQTNQDQEPDTEKEEQY